MKKRSTLLPKSITYRQAQSAPVKFIINSAGFSSTYCPSPPFSLSFSLTHQFLPSASWRNGCANCYTGSKAYESDCLKNVT
ncbi:hypothetical protein PUN28_015709 [Cardiocondyla obscurior]|uniref:Uncharacterized protein n=1 Tax=Cardiocondyla obscurior TaxID=286306 RepID=A0AAW2EY61_9HYME